MSSAFTHTMRSLEGDTFGPLVRLSAVGIVLLAIWIGWARWARTPVYATSPTGRVEVSNIAFPVEPSSVGKVVASHIALGRSVKPGDVLLVLDSSVQEALLAEHNVRLSVLEAKTVTLREQIALYERVVAAQDQLTGAQAEEVRIRTAAATSALARAENINDISRHLADERLTSTLSHLSNENATLEQRDLLAVAQSQAHQAQLTRTLEARRSELQLADARRAITDVEGEATQLRATIHSLNLEIERHTLRAPAAGVLGDVMPLQVGMVVGPGRPLATIIPQNDLRVVASFTPSDAVGRIRRGQKAYFRFDGFPWTQYGIPEGTVRAVASEPRDRTIRVELDVKRETATLIPMQHGLTAAVEIEIEHASPWTMLLRSMGAASRAPAAQREQPRAEGAP